MRSRILLSLLTCAFLVIPALGDDLKVLEPPEDLRRSLKLDPFYKKCVITEGLAIVSSAKVSDHALLEAAHLVDKMLTGRGDLRKALISNRIRVAVMSPSEFTIHIPEHSDLKPPEYWNKRARGLGATKARPAVSCGEENLLEYKGDPYRGENILIHEFAHAIHGIALREVDKTFDGRLGAAYDQALRDGLWKGTYAATNRSEYWAEGVQSWFDCNRAKDSQHNGVTTREKLIEYDPRLAKLMEETFGKNEWRYFLPSRRKDAGHLTGFDRTIAPTFRWPADMIKAYDEYQAKKKAGKGK